MPMRSAHEGLKVWLRQMESAESRGDEDRNSEQDMEKFTEKYFPEGQQGPPHLPFQPVNTSLVSFTHQ